jgi:hypothetical protein
MSYDEELERYNTELEARVEALEKMLESVKSELAKAVRLISILDGEQSHHVF